MRARGARYEAMPAVAATNDPSGYLPLSNSRNSICIPAMRAERKVDHASFDDAPAEAIAHARKFRKSR